MRKAVKKTQNLGAAGLHRIQQEPGLLHQGDVVVFLPHGDLAFRVGMVKIQAVFRRPAIPENLTGGGKEDAVSGDVFLHIREQRILDKLLRVPAQQD